MGKNWLPPFVFQHPPSRFFVGLCSCSRAFVSLNIFSRWSYVRPLCEGHSLSGVSLESRLLSFGFMCCNFVRGESACLVRWNSDETLRLFSNSSQCNFRKTAVADVFVSFWIYLGAQRKRFLHFGPIVRACLLMCLSSHEFIMWFSWGKQYALQLFIVVYFGG